MSSTSYPPDHRPTSPMRLRALTRAAEQQARLRASPLAATSTLSHEAVTRELPPLPDSLHSLHAIPASLEVEDFPTISMPVVANPDLTERQTEQMTARPNKRDEQPNEARDEAVTEDQEVTEVIRIIQERVNGYYNGNRSHMPPSITLNAAQMFQLMKRGLIDMRPYLHQTNIVVQMDPTIAAKDEIRCG